MIFRLDSNQLIPVLILSTSNLRNDGSPYASFENFNLFLDHDPFTFFWIK